MVMLVRAMTILRRRRTTSLNSLHSRIRHRPVYSLNSILDCLYRAFPRNWGRSEEADLAGEVLTEHCERVGGFD